MNTMPSEKTNSDSPLLTALLSVAKIGTFTYLVRTKVGEERKGVRYGDDTVATTIVTGFNYERLVQRSLDALPTIKDEDIVALAADLGLVDAKTGAPVSLQDVAAAREELEASFKNTLTSGESEATTAHVYEPLVWEGEVVKSTRVYKCVKDLEGVKCHCQDCTGDPKAPKDGTIYLQGLRISTEVLVAAPNGPVPKAKSAAKTLAKNLLKDKLPIGRYVSHPLPKGGQWILKVGGTALVESQKNGLLVTDDILDILARAA